MSLPNNLVRLDNTLHDLYSLDDEIACDTIVALYALPSNASDGQSSNASPNRFSYQINLARNDAQHRKMMLFQQNTMQRHSFLTGSLYLALLDNANSNPSCVTDTVLCANHVDAQINVLQLSPDQVPELHFINSAAELSLGPDARISIILPDDRLLGLPHLVNPEVHYELSSKRWLALSNLPTPRTTVLDIRSASSNGANFGATIDDQINYYLNQLDVHCPPFVIKLPMSVSGRGTFKILSASDKHAVSESLRPVLREMLTRPILFNEHLHASSLIIQELVSGDAMGISIFVTKKGNVVPISYNSQMFDEDGHWHGAVIQYNKQGELKQLYADTVNNFARELFQKGYHGPAGADVMIDEAGRQLIIDVNPRLTGAYHLGLLKSHFTSRGLLAAAGLTSLVLPCTRSAFEKASPFADKVKAGSLVINAWSHDPREHSSIASITLGAKDGAELEILVEGLRQYCAH